MSGCALTQFGGDLQAGDAGHRDVEHGHVGRQLERQGERLRPIRCLADDREAGLGLEHVADAGPDDGVVVGDEHADGRAVHVTPAAPTGTSTSSEAPDPLAPPKRTLPPRALMRSRMPASPM